MIVPQNIQRKVEARIAECISIASEYYDREFSMPTIQYKLRGQTAGKAWSTKNLVDLNSVLLVENEDDYISRTPGHEVAHIIDKAVHGYRTKLQRGRIVRDSHGEGWKTIMRLFGQDPSRCHNFDTTNSTVRKTSNRTKYVWTCGCGGSTMELGAKRHNKQRLTPRFYMRGHTTRRCGAYTHTHTIVAGVKTKVGQLDRNFMKTVASVNRKPKTKMPRVGTKASRAVELVRQYNFLSRDQLISILMNKLNMKRAGAQTYFYNAKKALGADY